ncbi:MAG: type II toxin-antitoxin system RelE/ParE family toxin [Cyclobacteriaceae bacterium]
MIENFKSKALKKFFVKGDDSKINPNHRKRIKRILFVLNNGKKLEDFNMPGWNFHPLKGNLKGMYAIEVSGNFRVIFRFENGKVMDVDYLDYH